MNDIVIVNSLPEIKIIKYRKYEDNIIFWDRCVDVNDFSYMSKLSPTRFKRLGKKEFKKNNQQYSNFLRKFRKQHYKHRIGRVPTILHDCFSELIDLSKSDDKLKKFVECKEIVFKSAYNVYFIITFRYYEIREPVVSYLLQTGYDELGEKLQEEFNFSLQKISYDEALREKARELLGLDLESYLISIKNEPKKGDYK